MAEQLLSIVFTPNKDATKKDILFSGTIIDPAANRISVGIGATVATRRGTEIINAFRFLANGIKDRNLIDRGAPDFNAQDLVSAVDIDVLTANDRRTASTLLAASVTANDVVVTMDSSCTTLTYRTDIDNCFEVLIRGFQEWLYKNG